jgi:hypothetical protein
MALSAADIDRAFSALSEQLASEGVEAEIFVVGGAALVLLFAARQTTKDVDVFFVKPEAAVVRRAAQIVAAKLNLPEGWLNDGAKGYIVGLSTGTVLHNSPSLTARAASTAQLLAMKLAAWRDAIDRADARLLLSELRGTKDLIWKSVEPFVPTAQIDKASYAFEDLWETTHGSS